jgi:hypothetical protein
MQAVVAWPDGSGVERGTITLVTAAAAAMSITAKDF